ncbi:MAG: hypothetical protein JNL54_05205 [Kineosporiaceae bacterium]|nr:hypothetical protein [Kineosporiaceae bacterium]
MSADRGFEQLTVNARIAISALWTSTMFVFAYVDLFSFYRPDFRADVEAGTVSGFTVGETFLLGTTAYILLPSMMVFLTLVLPARIARAANLALSAVYALTIVGGALGEWGYYVLGSAVEVALLAGVAWYAWTWPRVRQPVAVS